MDGFISIFLSRDKYINKYINNVSFINVFRINYATKITIILILTAFGLIMKQR